MPSNDAGQIYSLDFLDMVSEIRQEQSRVRGCPLLVHCSAGIGRTGTYIAIDQGISVIQNQKGTTQPATIDVNDLINTIREDRMALVQNTAQYKFAYQALLDFGTSFFFPTPPPTLFFLNFFKIFYSISAFAWLRPVLFGCR